VRWEKRLAGLSFLSAGKISKDMPGTAAAYRIFFAPPRSIMRECFSD
jgi:hypothetical protein